jgi:hypothetical protein
VTVLTHPKPGFDWSLVSWYPVDQPRPKACSYCGEPLRDGDLPLLIRSSNGHLAEFCAQCERHWWGTEWHNNAEITKAPEDVSIAEQVNRLRNIARIERLWWQIHGRPDDPRGEKP